MGQLLRQFFVLILLSVLSSFGALASELPVYIYRSPLTAEFFRLNGASYDKLLAMWKGVFRDDDPRYQEVTRKQLLMGLDMPGTLVLASALLLDEEERRAIRDFSKAGGGVVATWGTGTRDGQGKWLGYGFVEQMLDMKVSGQITRKSSSWHLMPHGETPLNPNIPAGQRIYLGKTPEDLIVVESPRLAGAFMDWSRSLDEKGVQGAVAYHEGAGRSVYLGFSESTWHFMNPTIQKTLISNVLTWAARTPAFAKAAWPKANQAALLLEMDTEDKFQSALIFADHLEKIGLRGTFYCLTSIAVQFPEVVRTLLARGHEIAYHADVHFGFTAAPAKLQEQRILNMKAQMKSILGPRSSVATGFRAPTEGYDDVTEKLLRRHGILHHAADPASTEARLPFFSKSEPEVSSDEALVVLPRTQNDDVNFSRLGWNTSKTIRAMLQDLEMSVDSGALGLLSVHSQNYVAGGLMNQVMPAYLEKVAQRRDHLWVARGDEIAAWWRQRERVTYTHQPSALGHHSWTLQVAPGADVEGLTVMAFMATAGSSVKVRQISGSPVRVQIKPLSPHKTAIVFDRLIQGEYRFDFSER